MNWFYLESSIRLSKEIEPPLMISFKELLPLLIEGRAVMDDIYLFPMVVEPEDGSSTSR